MYIKYVFSVNKVAITSTFRDRRNVSILRVTNISKKQPQMVLNNYWLIKLPEIIKQNNTIE